MICNLSAQQSYTLTTQAEVDNFHYTGWIDGLTITGNDITHLDSLQSITHINGPLNIVNTQIFSLHGLHNLVNVQSVIYIKDNPLLNDISALDSLIFDLFLGIHIENNSSLTSINGFNKIQYIYGQINITNNQSLQEIQGFNSLDSIGSFFPPFCTAGVINISNNPQLESISGFKQLKKVGSTFEISYNAMLEEVQELDSLGFIGCDLAIIDNTSLSQILPFDKLTNIGGDLVLGNTAIQNIDTIFPQLKNIGNNIIITNNLFLQTIVDFPELDSVGGLLQIINNKLNNGIQGFNKLKYSKGIIYSYNFESQMLMGGFSQLNKVGDHGIYITHNDSLKVIQSFSILDTITGSLVITQNNSLNIINGFYNLSNIGVDLAIGGYPFPEYNPITNIQAFNHPISIGRDLTIRQTFLSDCAVICVCQYLDQPSGTANILNNQSGCNSPEEVTDHCVVNSRLVTNRSTPTSFTIFPNPASDEVYIEMLSNMPKGVNFKFFDSTGKTFLSITPPQALFAGDKIQIINTMLPNGIYYCLQFSADSNINNGIIFFINAAR